MPGLLGIFHKGLQTTDVALFKSMVASLNHRSIYENDIFIDEDQRSTIANVRLPILRYEGSPFISGDRKLKIWMHGEIYHEGIGELNQLTYIYELYQKYGFNFVEHLNGSFVIFIIDEIKKCIVIANDRTASKPLFYFTDGSTLYCAPELKSLLLIPHIRKHMNLSGVAGFLSCGYFLDGETWIEDVKLLDNATVLVFSEHGVQFIKYWEFVFDENVKDLGLKYYQYMLSELITKSVQSRLKTNHRYGILLSGGYDSRGILGCVLREKDVRDIKTISWGDKEDINDSDCAVAKRLAEKLGVHHTFYRLRPEEFTKHVRDFVYLSDGLTDAYVNYPESLKIIEKIRTDLNVDILLRGDECFGWLSTAFDDATMFQSIGICPIYKVNAFKEIIDHEQMAKFEGMMNEKLHRISEKTSLRKIHNRKDFFYLDQRLKGYLNPLTSVKRIEIEQRSPYIDNNILDFLVKLPEKYRLNKNLYIKTICSMFPEIFTEVAYKGNLIDWKSQLNESEVIREFLREEFSKRSLLLDGIINNEKFNDYRTRAREELRENRLRENLTMFRKKYPAIYNGMKYIQAHLRRKTGQANIELPHAVIMQRILTVKIWCDLFLEEKAERATE